MYAIRSYYVHGWYTNHCSLLCQYSLKVPIQATVQHLYDKNKISFLFTELLGQANIRITSYNVCYTKLLRPYKVF